MEGKANGNKRSLIPCDMDSFLNFYLSFVGKASGSSLGFGREDILAEDQKGKLSEEIGGLELQLESDCREQQQVSRKRSEEWLYDEFSPENLVRIGYFMGALETYWGSKHRSARKSLYRENNSVLPGWKNRKSRSKTKRMLRRARRMGKKAGQVLLLKTYEETSLNDHLVTGQRLFSREPYHKYGKMRRLMRRMLGEEEMVSLAYVRGLNELRNLYKGIIPRAFDVTLC